MSRSWPMLMLRGSTYYYHRNVPKRLRPLLGGKAQIWNKSDPVSLDTVWTTMTAAKEAGHEGQGTEAHHDSWQ